MQKKSIVLAIALALTAPVAFAETDKAELEKLRTMVQELDQKIRALEREIERKNTAPAQATASAGAAAAKSATASAPASLNTSSGVTFYGQIDLSYDRINTGASAAGVAGVSKGNVSSNVSRIGFKGSEALDDGLAAIWQIEQQINIDNAGGTFATRNSFVGLKSDSAGTVLLGRYDTPYKLATRRLDPFADSIADNRALMGGVALKSANTAFDGRPTDTISYTSPSVNGFSGIAAYANTAEGNTTAAQAKSNIVSVAGIYDAAPFFGSLGYEEHMLDTVRAGGKESAWKLGAGYTMDAFILGLVYEKTSDNLGGVAPCAANPAGSDCFGHNAYWLTGQYKFGKDAIKLAYGKAGQVGNTANTGASQFSLGYDHGLTKRTKLYANYSRISNDSGASYGFSQTSATTGNATINGVGASPSVVSLGMRHSF
ncbi:porin [Candidatus Ferrigenium straubiae]|jgi:predicted porin|uniref:porin n=1 Tax=Candidatus Ferrigenium straubiae TaxID=2919506 RepID=UPI003F4A8751